MSPDSLVHTVAEQARSVVLQIDGRTGPGQFRGQDQLGLPARPDRSGRGEGTSCPERRASTSPTPPTPPASAPPTTANASLPPTRKLAPTPTGPRWRPSSKPRTISIPTSASSFSRSRHWWPSLNSAPAFWNRSSPAPRCGFRGVPEASLSLDSGLDVESAHPWPRQWRIGDSNP